MQRITSPSNPLIKGIRSLDRKKNRWNSRVYVVEGIKMVREAIENGLSLKKVVFTDNLKNSVEGAKLYEQINDLDQAVHMPRELFGKISNVENTQGILGLVGFDPRGIESIPQDGLLIYLDGLQDPGNMGTIIRSADAFGIDGIIVGDNSVDPYNPKVVRATMGSIFRVPLFFEVSGSIRIHSLGGRRIVTTSLEDAYPLDRVEFRSDDIVVIGNEGNGVSDDLMKMSDLRIIIPMVGNAESLNAGVAASIIMYESSRQMMK